MKRLVHIINSNKVLFQNFTSLSILQIANYFIPIITLPYLVRVLGAEKYGLVNFAAAFAAYFVIITDYGFNLSATQEIAVNRDDKKYASEIFSTVFTIKIIFFTLSSSIFCLVVFFVPHFHSNFNLFFITFLGVLGQTLFPYWFFQGIEKMNYILVINLSVRFIITILIFILITEESDFIIFAALNTAAQIIIGIVGLVMLLFRFKLNYLFPNKQMILHQLKIGWNLFLSSVWINLYTTSNYFILGMFAPVSVVGFFAAADKIRLALQGVLMPVSQSVYPHVNKIINESYDRFISFNKKLIKAVFAVGVIISLSLFLFAEPIVKIILGDGFASSIVVLRIIAWLPLIILLSNVLGLQIMLPLNKQKSFATILFFAAMINLTLSFILVPIYLEIGTSISVLITEIFVTITFFIFLKRNSIELL